MADMFLGSFPNLTTTKAGLSAGTTTTISTANTIIYSIGHKPYIKTAITNGATPTTDITTGKAFVGLTANNGTVFVFGLDASGNLAVAQGPVNALDAAGKFIVAPQFPELPDTVAPFAYLVALGASNLSGTWTFGSSNLSSVTGMTYNFQDVLPVLPMRPQVS